MKIDQFFIGLALFSLFMVAGSMIFFGTASDYDRIPDMTDFNGSQNTTGTYAVLNEMYDDIAVEGNQRLLGNESTAVGSGTEGAEDSLFRGGFRVLKLIPKSYSLVDAIMEDLVVKLHLPAIFKDYFKVLFILLILFAVIALIWRMTHK